MKTIYKLSCLWGSSISHTTALDHIVNPPNYNIWEKYYSTVNKASIELKRYAEKSHILLEIPSFAKLFHYFQKNSSLIIDQQIGVNVHCHSIDLKSFKIEKIKIDNNYE